MTNSLHKEKSNFAQTCNLLSQYLKGRGGLGDIGQLGISGKIEAKGPETSRNNNEFVANLDNSMADNASVTKPMDLFPQFTGFSSPITAEDTTSRVDLCKPSTVDSVTAQMTIFYGGQVIVFNDFPSDKAKEIVALAGSSNGFASTSVKDQSNSTNSAVPESTNNAQDRLQLRPQANGSDLPIPRRASLYRFLEKRKHRISAKAPYQIHIPNPVDGSKSWLESEGKTSKQLELES
ncbi:hypothetical protein K2173_009450 [Erythroxylum novogranatense]|uniref:Protein TIFY n=1 Tax=Erythroxylum novogranatense TaxID=1862640 RepID=A0AAV8U752_9ROSI|nr:hypothetical protein K2173_009450 [Erythroxylum novogranatense]